MLDSFHYTRDDPFVKGVTPKGILQTGAYYCNGLDPGMQNDPGYRSLKVMPDIVKGLGTLVLRNSQRDLEQGMVMLILH